MILLALDHADDESGQVVFALGIEAGHLGGFAADERAAVVLAGLGQAGDDLLGDLRLQLADGEVVHEEQRRGALHGDVVDAVVHQVGADGVVQLISKASLSLVPTPSTLETSTGSVNFFLSMEEPAKAADLAEHAALKVWCARILDALLGAVGLLDVDACVGVGEASRLGRLICQGWIPFRGVPPQSCAGTGIVPFGGLKAGRGSVGGWKAAGKADWIGLVG